jgi:hypothetical protein
LLPNSSMFFTSLINTAFMIVKKGSIADQSRDSPVLAIAIAVLELPRLVMCYSISLILQPVCYSA